jgi:glucose/arabinose dehydrogenase
MPIKALDPAGFRIILTLLMAMVPSAVYGQSERDFESEFAQPRLIHTADAGEILVVPFAQGLANPFDLAFRANGDILVTERYTGQLRIIRRTGCLLGGLSGGTHVGCSASR